MSVLSNIQFSYDPPEMGREYHRIQALEGDEIRGQMHWDTKGVRNIGVVPTHQRQGLATAMWNEGMNRAGGRVPMPKHSADRTDAGDAWARSVGGKLPRRQR